MAKKLLLSVIFTLVMVIASGYGYDYLQISDPRGWRYGQGTIEEAVISVRPRGLFMEYGLYLTFSARGLYFGSGDSLEVVFYFDLPAESIVHDSWLWIGEDIIRGKIMDKWTAAAIYEDIVRRRRDPSILYKREAGNYELRIFPMAGNESRKVKITYLAPTQWTRDKVFSALPTNLLRTSFYPVAKFYLLTWLDSDWQNPSLAEFPNIQFTSYNDSTFGNFIQANITPDAIQSALNFSVSAPLKNGIYLSKYQEDQEGLYQLAFLPSVALNITAPRKVALLFDYDASKSTVSKNEILNTIKSSLFSQFTASDSFNLIFTGLTIKRVSEDWLPADSSTIEKAIGQANNLLSSYSAVPVLLANGIDFIKNNGNNGTMALISDSDYLGDHQTANGLIQELMQLMNPILPIHVVDFQNSNYSYHWIGGRTYYGNEYFYTNLTRMTTASYYSARSGLVLSQMLSQAFQSLGGFMPSFDLYTRMQAGFCHSRFSSNFANQSAYIHRPILQVGKYTGTFPMAIEVSGLYQDELFSRQFEIHEQEVSRVDSLARAIWTGRYIQSLEAQPQTNDIVNEIVKTSLAERVLSLYTAFLCLEPAQGGEVCYDCADESSVVAGVEATDAAEKDSLIQAYPNPFNSRTIITIKLSLSVQTKDLSFRIFNVLGQVVRTFSAETLSGLNHYQFAWDGTDDYGVDVSTGTYFFVVSSPQNRQSLKLLYIK